jgi:hypothetical protein
MENTDKNVKQKEYDKEYALKNKEKISKRKKEYYLKNKGKIISQQKERYSLKKEEIIEKGKIRFLKNKEKYKESDKNWYQKNKEKILYKQKERYKINGKEKIKERRKNDPIFKLKHSVSNRLRNFLKSKGISKKNTRTFEIVGCTPNFLKKYLEEQFKEGMNWQNHGEWHIDHIIPLESAKTEEEVFKLNHYSNLQPLWKEENLSKGCKI